MDPVLSIVIDKKSIAEALAPVRSGLQEAGDELLTRLGQAAVRLLSTMDRRAGHPFLSQQWTTSKIVTDDAGSQIEVYSAAESKTLYTPSGNPSSRYARSARTPWSVKGSELIAFLEYGVSEHSISPRRAEWSNGQPARLTFNVVEADPESDNPITPVSDFLGTVRTKRGVEIGIVDNRAEHDPLLVAPFSVNHPGFPGFRFLEATRQEIERGLQAEIDAAERNLVVRLV